jgi:two-component system, cell cycle sensor histidine kinase and response regulator CckA
MSAIHEGMLSSSAEVWTGETQETADRQILVVDDEKPMCFLVHAFLTKTGQSVLQASSELECLAVWSREKETITDIIMDVNLGTSDGRQLARRLRDEKPDVRILFISGCSPEYLEDDSLREGINFLPKPFTLHDLKCWVDASK